jgi:hypothetical protein
MDNTLRIELRQFNAIASIISPIVGYEILQFKPDYAEERVNP